MKGIKTGGEGGGGKKAREKQREEWIKLVVHGRLCALLLLF